MQTTGTPGPGFRGGIRLLLRLVWLAALITLPAPGQPPVEPGKSFLPDTLLELARLDSTIRLDIRYATPNNFMHRPMYAQARAFLQKAAARALLGVQRNLRARGYGLLVFDAYRPWSVTKQFWDETPPAKRNFVADPARGSKHNRGCAVDLSLYRLSDGREIAMPSPYDDFTEKASPGYRGGTAHQRRMRDLLRKHMEAGGFAVDPGEWWHFDYSDWAHYRILDVPFDSIP